MRHNVFETNRIVSVFKCGHGIHVFHFIVFGVLKMLSIKLSSIFVLLIACIDRIQCDGLLDDLGDVVGDTVGGTLDTVSDLPGTLKDAVNDVTSILQNPLCQMNTVLNDFYGNKHQFQNNCNCD